jgi:hypothetical protein
MSGWIKWEKDLKDDPRVIRMASRLRNSVVTQVDVLKVTEFLGEGVFVAIVLGGLGKLWGYADTHVRDDDTIELGIDDINKVVGVKGFAQILPEDWLEIIDPETVKLPGFHVHNGTIAKKKALTQKRVAKHRENVTLESLGVQRKGNARVTHKGVLDQERDQDLNQDSEKRERAPRGTDDQWFLDFKLVYPNRAGDQNWSEARRRVNARLKEGHTPEQILEGGRRYAAYCKATESTDTQFVKQAAVFVGPAKHFMDAWTLPPNKADLRLVSNLSEAQEFMRRTEQTT